jgi:uncharacterized Zn-binding protein involved in type VI secretion
MKNCTAFLVLLLWSGLALGQDVPACAVTGSKTVMIGGKPALRLSDVVMCPPDSYEIISSIQIDGQPMVHFKHVQFGKTRCAVMGDATVMAEGKPTPQDGAHCSTN